MEDERVRAENHRTKGTANIGDNICLQGIYFTETKITKSIYIGVTPPLILFQKGFWKRKKKGHLLRKE